MYSSICDVTEKKRMKEKVAAATGDNENLMRKQRTELRLALFSADE